MLLTGAEIVIECLKEQGVDTVFGYPGGAILNVYDELYKHSNEIKHILTSMSRGFPCGRRICKSTGKVGVCFATSGPGATNLVTGIATAYMDSVPMVAITCNVNVPLLGKDSFRKLILQELPCRLPSTTFIVKMSMIWQIPSAGHSVFKKRKTGSCPCGYSKGCHCK